MFCLMCSADLHASCLDESCDCNLQSHQIEKGPSLGTDPQDSLPGNNGTRNGEIREVPEILGSRSDTDRYSSRFEDGVSRGWNPNSKDPQSTGRKRAAKLFPLNATRACEWQGYSKCGGGSSPILGCVSGTQQARHHGPEKNVANNEFGNVHRICHYCHNRWHTANDSGYDWNDPDTTPHSPIKMTVAEQQAAALDEMRYLSTKHKKVKD